MNNRFKELALEATVWCEHYAKGTPTAWEWEQKFAELIVQECVGQVNTQLGHEFNDSIGSVALIEVRRAINEHFGIERLS